MNKLYGPHDQYARKLGKFFIAHHLWNLVERRKMQAEELYRRALIAYRRETESPALCQMAMLEHRARWETLERRRKKLYAILNKLSSQSREA